MINEADEIVIPSVFLQDEYKWNEKNALLAGVRYDYDDRHGNIFSPRLALKHKFTDNDILRLNAGTGFRVVNLFTEDHAALSGAREVIITEALKPEQSWNLNLNYLKKIYHTSGTYVGIDASVFYTNFSNVILPDYETDPNSIIYSNLDGTAVSQGVSASVNVQMPNGIRALAGATLQDVSNTIDGETDQQILTERFNGTWSLGYTFRKMNLSVDYTGNLYGPMRLPIFAGNPNETRSEFSPWWSIQNIQFTYKKMDNLEFFGGVKNLLDFTPNRNNDFIISNASDPFDRNPAIDADNGQLPFDPTYIYAPNQGIRAFFGIRYTLL